MWHIVYGQNRQHLKLLRPSLVHMTCISRESYSAPEESFNPAIFYADNGVNINIWR